MWSQIFWGNPLNIMEPLNHLRIHPLYGKHLRKCFEVFANVVLCLRRRPLEPFPDFGEGFLIEWSNFWFLADRIVSGMSSFGSCCSNLETNVECILAKEESNLGKFPNVDS